MTIHLHTMATARARCAELGITAARSLAETVERIKAKEAETFHPIGDEGHGIMTSADTILVTKPPKMCDCDPAGDAAREHYHGLGKQPCDCAPDDTVDAMAYAMTAQPVPENAGCTTEVGADGVRRVTGMHLALGAPYGAQPEVIGIDYGSIEARALAHDIEAAKRDTPPATPAYGVLSRRMMTMIRNQPKASVPGSVRRRMQREAAQR